MSQVDVFASKLMDSFSKDITDRVFLHIQENRDLMKSYLRLVESDGLDNVNRVIGKAIKLKLNLDNLPKRNKEPKSTLIQSHQQFSK